MDIHRCRFVPHPSAPINALAFSRTHDKGLQHKPVLKLALGRSNGDLEIWSPGNGDWVQETVFAGAHGSSIDGLVWTQDPDESAPDGRPIIGQLRLFSIGSSAAVTEWDMVTGRPLRESTGNFSEVWCIAAQPRAIPPKAGPSTNGQDGLPTDCQNIMVGCGDGTLAMLSTADNDLTSKRFMARTGKKKTRCMSVIWQSRERVVAGFNDSVIRVYDVRNGSLLRNMSMGAGIPGAPRDTLIWRIKTLPDGDIVTADSNGEIRIWDGKNYSLIQRLAGHSSDCLELVTSSDGQTIFSGGLDGRLAVYKLTGQQGQRRHWAKVGQRRLHKGDIKAMAVHDTKAHSVVVSGGLDASPTFTPLRDHGRTTHRRVAGLPQSPPCVSVPSKRLLICWWDQIVTVWHVAKQSDGARDSERSRKMVGRIMLQGDESITSAAASSDGRLLVVSTSVAIKAFRVASLKEHSDARLHFKTLGLPISLSDVGAKVLQISPDNRWLSIIAINNDVLVARLDQDANDEMKVTVLEKTVELERVNRKDSAQSGTLRYDRNILCSAFSSDSSVFAVADVAGYIDSWVLQGHYDSTAPAMDTSAPEHASSDKMGSDSDDSSSDDDDETVIFYGQHWTDMPAGINVPRLDSTPLVISFRPADKNAKNTTNGNPGIHPTRANPHAHSHALPTARSHLLAITQSHSVYEFDMLAGTLTDWSRRNPTSSLPSGLGITKDRVKGILWEVLRDGSEQYERAWLYGVSWLAMLDVSQDHVPQRKITAVKSKSKDQANGNVSDEHKSKKIKVNQHNVPTHELGGLVSSTRRLIDGAVVNDEAHTTNGDDQEDIAMTDDLDSDVDDMPNTLDTDNAQTPIDKSKKRRKWWTTYKYKPIVGIVPISDSTDESDKVPMEVVLVERPDWDLEQIRELEDEE